MSSIKKNINKKPELLKILSVGGGGTNSLNNIINSGLINTESCMSFNTDSQTFEHCKSINKVLMGDDSINSGVGAGAKMEEGLRLAQLSETKILDALEKNHAHVYFVIICSGGGTGSGSGPEVIRLIKQKYPGSIVIAIVTKPFKCEGSYRSFIAVKCIEEISKYADFYTILNNEKILEYNFELDIQDSFRIMDSIICEKIYYLKKAIQEMGFMNIDMADLRSITMESGNGIIATTITNPANLENDLDKSLANGIVSILGNEEFVPLSEYSFISDNGALVYMEGHNITTNIMERVLSKVNRYVATGAKVIPGVHKTDFNCLISEKYAKYLKLNYVPTSIVNENSVEQKVLVHKQKVMAVLQNLKNSINYNHMQRKENPFIRYRQPQSFPNHNKIDRLHMSNGQMGPMGQIGPMDYNYNGSSYGSSYSNKEEKKIVNPFEKGYNENENSLENEPIINHEKLIEELEHAVHQSLLRIFVIFSNVKPTDPIANKDLETLNYNNQDSFVYENQHIKNNNGNQNNNFFNSSYY